MLLSAVKKLIGQTATYGLSSIVGRLLNYLLVPIYVRLFLTGEYGIISELFSYIAISMALLTHGMEVTYFRFSSQEKKDILPTAMFSHIVVVSLLVIGYFIFQDNVLALMSYEEYPDLINYLVWILVADTLSTIPFAKLRNLGKAKYFAFVKLSNIAINIGLNLYFLIWCPMAIKNDWPLVGLAKASYNPDLGIEYIFIATLVAGLWSLLLLAPTYIKVKWTIDKDLWKRMLKYAWPLMIAGLAYVVNEALDRILLRHWLPFSEEVSLQQIGIYSACYKLSIIMTLFIQSIRLGIEPFFFSHSKKENAQATYAVIMKYVILIGVFIFLGVCFYIDIIKHFLDPAYFEGLVVVPILLLANLMLGIYFNLSVWYKLSGKTYHGAYISIIGAMVTLGLNYLLIPTLGYLGSAWATLAAYSSMVVLSYLIGRKNYQFEYDLKNIGLGFLIGLCLYAISVKIEAGMLMDTGLLAIFIIWVYFSERKNLSKLLRNEN
ncbi:MAG: O-antigen/teichoic acid export membrane protein [Flavobacteriales bacterium]